MTHPLRSHRRTPRPSLLLLLLAWLAPALLPGRGAAPAGAQTPAFEPLLSGHRVAEAQYGGGRVYAGLQRGGLAEWHPDTGQTLRVLTRRDGLGGHFVQDLAWVAGRLWVATADGGLTVISNPGTTRESLRVYSSALSSFDVTAVAGEVLGDTERIYYGTSGQGFGVILGGLPGDYFTTQDGLLDDTIVDLAVTNAVLLAATPSGLSRFADNAFTNYPYSDPATPRVNALQIGPDGAIWAATNSGVKRWDDAARQFEPVFGSAAFTNLAVDGQVAWASGAAAAFRIEGGAGLQVDLPAVLAERTYTLDAIAAGGGRAWCGGLVRGAGMVNFLGGSAWLAEAGDAAREIVPLPTCEIGASGNGFCGVAFDDRGRAWLGDFLGDGLAGYDGDTWYNVTQLATAENGFAGLFDHSGPILVMARAGDAIWFVQAGVGVIRYRPAAAPGGQQAWDLVHPGNSGLRARSFVAINVHPDGPVFFCSDDADDEHRLLGVDVLVDPDNWQQESSWLHLEPAVLGGNNIWAVGFERRDLVWFGVRQAGLQRWDLNGPDAGPDDPLTWEVSGPGRWLAAPLATLPGGTVELEGTNAIVQGPDGSLWAGGNGGLVNFRYEAQRAVLLGEWTERTQPFVAGLLAQQVVGLAIDRNAHLWALTSAGLNRLRLGTQPLVIDAYTDLATYVLYNPALYSPSVIAALPGPTYHHLAADPDGARLVLSGNRGGALVTVPALGEDAERLLAAGFLYPNPFPGGGEGSLFLGGLDLDPAELVTVEILNTAGEVVYRIADVHNQAVIWDGRNRQGRRVAAGLYLVKIAWAGHTVLKTLAVAY